MDTRLRHRLERLDRQKAALIEGVAGIEDDRLNRQPGPGEWSVIQVLCHLCQVEELSAAFLRERMPADAPRIGVGHRLRFFALSLAMRSPLRFRGPAGATEVPVQATLRETESRWSQARGELASALAEVPSDCADRAVFRHPRAGWISLEQALRFLSDHLAHHERQIERALRPSRRADGP